MQPKQAKKIFTRMVMNNWGGVSHKVMEFHEYVNLFSGKSGSGKSTVMDAIQVILYGSVSSTFLNKAADDAKNKRSVLSYLRGAQKDGSSNREGQDFCAQIVLEIEDTGTHIVNCVGVAFEIGRNDQDLKKYSFFSHSGRIPEDEYLDEQGVPYTIAKLKKLIEERAKSADNRGRGDVNRMYPSKESYLNTLYDVIFGDVEPGRMMTMEKSAIALRMTNGTGQFIRDYMFPKSKEETVSTISEQLGAYREIKERVEDLEKRIELLDAISRTNLSLLQTKTDRVHVEQVLKYIDLNSCRVRLEAKEQDMEELLHKLSECNEKLRAFEEKQTLTNQELLEVRAELKASDYGQKEKELEAMERTIALLADYSGQWRGIADGLKQWEEDEEISGYVSNPALHLIEEVRSGNVNEEKIKKLKKYLSDSLEMIEEELDDLNTRINRNSADLKEKRDMVEELKNDRKPYRPELRKVRHELQEALSRQYGRTIRVDIFADLFDIQDEKWKNAVEGRLGRIKRSLVTAPEYALDAAKAFRKMKSIKGVEDIDLINTAILVSDHPTAEQGTLYDIVACDLDYVDLCLKRYLGRIHMCESVEELQAVRDGVTADCYSYSNYIFRHLNPNDYIKYACIGTKVSKKRLRELEEEVYELEQDVLRDVQQRQGLKKSKDFERLNLDTERLVKCAGAADELEQYYEKQAQLLEEIRELKEGTRVAVLRQNELELNRALRELNEKSELLRRELIDRTKVQGQVEQEITGLKQRLSSLSEGLVINEVLQQEVEESLKHQSESTYRRSKSSEAEQLMRREEEEQEELLRSRNRFNWEYPSYGLDGMEHENDAYDRILRQCREDFEPKYKEEFQKQYDLIYHSLRENVIATIHGEIKAAFRHRRQINRMLEKIRFSDSVYQIDIMPAQNENGQFYEMLMAEELDSKVFDNQGFEGQLSLGEDAFYERYEEQIQRLTDKFMPPKSEDAQSRSIHRQQMEQYADYRNYLTFNMYEKVIDEDGKEKKNYVDEMAGRDSGGEGQNPKYVALLAGFAMLYMQQSNRDSKIRLVLLDEAFSKMDKERSEVCLRYARELDLQMIVCVPDERLQSLIRNVDSVYGFRRYQNQVTMMHIDKGDYLDMIEGELS